MYKITKIINNNVVCSVDTEGNEIILRGLGVGFKKKVHEAVEEDKVEKVYCISNPVTSNKLQQLLNEIPIEYVTVCTEIIEYAKRTLNRKLNDNIFITLTDHISFAIERKSAKLEYRNVLLSEIKTFYAAEYEVGKGALDIIKEKLGVELSYDEAGFIALHIVNAELDTNMSNTVKITQLIQQIVQIAEEYYGKELDESSMSYERFMTHLKFFGQRLFNNKVTKDEDAEFQNIVKNRYLQDYKCAEKIRDLIKEKYDKTITGEEMMFLTIHLRRLQMS